MFDYSMNSCATIISDSGPGIDIISPKLNGKCRSPVNIIVRFTPRNGKDVDLSKLKVELIRFIAIDMTSKLLPFVTKEGVDVENVKLPSGKHKLRVTVGDSCGGLTQLQFEVKII